MTRLRHLNRIRREQYSVLRRYLHERKVSTSLIGRIWSCMQNAKKKTKTLTHRSDVDMFDLLTKPLLAELLEEVYAPVLNWHPFFQTFTVENPVVARKIYK